MAEYPAEWIKELNLKGWLKSSKSVKQCDYYSQGMFWAQAEMNVLFTVFLFSLEELILIGLRPL